MPLFLGLDCSTQSMTGVIISSEEGSNAYQVVATSTFQFDQRLPHYGTTKGVLMSGENVLVPSLMLVEAVDCILQDLRVALEKVGRSLSQVQAVSGSAQQHTSVFWKHDKLQMPKDGRLVTFFKDIQAFQPECGRSWMDSSTSAHCKKLDEALGGSQRVAELTGSRSYERFTGIQLFAIGEQSHVARVSLASSMLTSVVHGAYCGIDESDGSGMNLMDISTRKWSEEVLEAIEKLGGPLKSTLLRYLGETPIPCHVSVGPVADYFVDTMGFKADCAVIPFSGDNPCTLAGMGLSSSGDVGVSLGTSTCLFAVGAIQDMRPAYDGHILVNPVDTSTLMAMLCFKNGSLARENVRDRRAHGSWEEFSTLMRKSPPGNNGILGFFYLQPEITPVVPAESSNQSLSGVYGFDSAGNPIDMTQQSPEVEIRAIVEWQCLSLLKYTRKLCTTMQVKRLVVGGGASVNACLLETLANVFNAPVFVEVNQGNTAALGGALRAMHGYDCLQQCKHIPFTPDIEYELKATPDAHSHQVYEQMLEKFNQLEAIAIKSQRAKFSRDG